MMPKKAAVAPGPKAVVIDDAYALPTADTLKTFLAPLRSYLGRNQEAKKWFDSTFGLSGKASTPTYFGPLMGSPEKLKLLWERRDQCPDPGYAAEAIVDLIAEVLPKKAPLLAIERELVSRGWQIESTSHLPASDQVSDDVSLIVLDYVLQEEMPDNVAAKVEESVKFVRDLLTRCAKGDRCPVVVLTSSLPSVKQKNAKDFKREAKLQGAFFRFIEKKAIAGDFGPYVDGMSQHKAELEAFWRFHMSFQSAMARGATAIQERMADLELQDLATLQVGQLSFEGESLGDYLAWLCGQSLTTHLQRDAPLASAAAALPPQSFKVLLGHLEPTQGIPALFAEMSSVKAASGQLLKKQTRKRGLRFGDVFADRAASKSILETAPQRKYYLLISQTCDLLHQKLDNGQVLCIEGTAEIVQPTEAELLKATFRQMAESGRIMLKAEGHYLQISWHSKRLVTLEQSALEKERRFDYVGRLNEIYALEAQQDALQALSRIGVPIKPGFSSFFSEATLRVHTSKREVAELARTLKNNVVLAALSMDKGQKSQLLLSSELRKWLVGRLGQLKSEAVCPTELHSLIDSLAAWMLDHEFRVLCKANTKGWVVSRELVKTGQPKSTEKIEKLELLLPDVTALGAPQAVIGVRLSLELTRLTDAAAQSETAAQ